jgi:hypothetical protein
VTLALRPSKPDYAGCKQQYVCLWQDAHGQGRMIWFKQYGTFKLKAYGMGPGKKGVSSYWNYQTDGARATLIGPNFRLGLGDYRGNVPRSMNDRATYVRLFP